ncbi:MAG TPA: trans-aconitate 2-methyltransferase [Terriglobia bacterium]|nr:trans-aconitate 2-methyltransferase [Terriglobia bacterium]
MPSWDADLYLKFASERTQPAVDLISRISLADPSRIIDLGCGPGNSTAILRQRWPAAEIVGLDNSREMIAAASQTYPDWTWVESDIATWTAAVPFDLVFSNAALHWVANHAAVMPRLLRQVRPHGALAIQMPAHFHSPVHELMIEIAKNPTWHQSMEKAIHAIKVERPAFYYDLLQPHTSKLDLWETEYIHVMDGPGGILEWIRGTGLRPFLEALPSDKQKRRFEELFLSGLAMAYPAQEDGRVLFPFRRLFILAYG